MARFLFWPSSILLLLGILVLPACGQQDTADVVSADCSGHIPREKLDSCLERVRVIDETDPSAPLQALEAQLEQRERHHDEAQSGSAPAGYGPDQGPPSGYASDQGPPPGYDPNQQPPPNYDPNDQMQGDQNTPPDARPIPSHAYGRPPASHGPRDLSPPDQPTIDDEMPPDDGPQGPPPDNTPPPDDSDTQGPN